MIVSGKKINWKSWKRYASPEGIKDFDKFLDALPVNVGYNAIIAVSLAWIIAGAAIAFTSMELQKVSQMHAELMQVEALKPPIPVLKYVPVNASVLKLFAKKIEETYKGVSLNVTGDGAVSLFVPDTDYFPQFITAISYLQRGGKNWKVKISTLCAGRGCASQKLSASLTVEMLRVNEAQAMIPREDGAGEEIEGPPMKRGSK